MLEFISKVKAQTLPNITNINPPASKFSSLTGLISSVLDWVLALASSLLVIAIIYSAILYITSGGDTTKAETAKKNLIWAITGLVIMLLFYLIIQWVQTIFA